MSKANLNKYVAAVRLILENRRSKKYEKMHVEEYPFDAQVLALSSLYRKSREMYVDLGGGFRPRVCSTMRSLSATDLFKDEIEYTPSETEVIWLSENHQSVFDPDVLAEAVEAFNGISLFHEQNHRIIWRLLPKVPKDSADVIRYLNFAEATIVTLDLALGDEIGPKLSPSLERMKTLYRPGGRDKWALSRAKDYRTYLHTLFYVTYLVLALVDRRDIPKCVDYVFSNQLQMNRAAIKRGLELSELFTQNTNREWQARFWKKAQSSLSRLQGAKESLHIVADPLDFENEFAMLDQVLDAFNI